MPDYVINWATADADGPNNITDAGGGSDVNVTVYTPDNTSAQGEFVYNASKGGLHSSYPDSDDPASINMTFSESVSDVTFELYDVDRGGSSWDDIVEIFAYDASGARLDVTFSGLDGQTTTDYTIDGNGILSGEAVTVFINGPVATLNIVFDHGSQSYTAGWITVGDISFNAYIPDCFTRGTMIETKHGNVAVEDLIEGDLVRTADNGFQPLRWIGGTTVAGTGKAAPILIKKDALGNTQDLLLSPAHRVVLQGWQTELLFDTPEMLVAAASLVNDSTIVVQKTDKVEYFHLLFDRHEIIFSNGAATESFHPGEADLGKMAQATRAEIFALFPELETRAAIFGPAARKTLQPHEVALLSV